MSAQLATAQAKLRLDVNFGDLVNPAPGLVELPALRPGYPPVRILGYPLAGKLPCYVVGGKVLRLKAAHVEALFVPADQCRGW